MLDNIYVILISLLVTVILTIFTIYDIYTKPQPFHGPHEAIWHVAIPLGIAFVWILLWGLAAGNWLSCIVFIYTMISVLFALALYASGAWWKKIRAPSYGRLYYNFNLGRYGREAGGAEFHHLPQWSMDLSEFTALMDDAYAGLQEKPKGESEERWNRHIAVRENYLACKDEIKTWKVTCLGFFDPTEKRISDRFKLVQYYHKFDIAKVGMLVGCGIEKKTRTYLRGRDLITYIVFAGLIEKEILQRIEPLERFLDVTENTEMVQRYKILELDNTRLEQDIERYSNAFRRADSRDWAVEKDITGREPEPQDNKPNDLLLLIKKYVRLAFVLIIGIVIVVILLMYFGVI